MQKLDLSAPWHIHRQKLAALFELDDAVTVSPVEWTENGWTVTLSVSDHHKAAALQKLLGSPEFGNVKLSVVVVDTAKEETPADILRAAFAYNPRFKGVETKTDPTGTEWTYLVAWDDTVQFPADNLNDYRGNLSMLAAVAARDVLTLEAGTAVCTADLTEN